MCGRGAGCLQWRTRDVVYAVCCTGNTGNEPHPQLTGRSFLFYCVTRPCMECPFCSLLLNSAWLYKSSACLYPTNWKSISQAMCYNFTPLSNELFWICGKFLTQEVHKVSLSDSSAGLGGPRPLLWFHKNSEWEDNSKNTNYLYYRKR